LQADIKFFSCFQPTSICSKTSLSMLFDSFAPAHLARRANLRLLYLKGPAFSIVVNSLGVVSESDSALQWLKNGSGEDADPPGRHSRSTPIILLSILQILSSCLKIWSRFPLAAKPHYLCPLIRSFPLGSPFGPTFGCSISKAPPFRLWSIP
jgi:hypothetical protein